MSISASPTKNPNNVGNTAHPKGHTGSFSHSPVPTRYPITDKRTEPQEKTFSQPGQEVIHGGELDKNFISDFGDGPFGCSLSLGFVCLWGWFLVAQVFVEA